jgi:LPS-assembly protein
VQVLALAAMLCLAGGDSRAQQGQAKPEDGKPAAPPTGAIAGPDASAAAPVQTPVLRLRLDRALDPSPSGAGDDALPGYLQANRLNVDPSRELSAQGAVEFRRGGAVLQADELSYRYADDTLRASGHVRISSSGARYEGPRLQLQLGSFEGWFEEPSFSFEQTGAGGRASRVEFLGPSRVRALQALYTSCPRIEGEEPEWELRADSVTLDTKANEGRAEGAQLRFQDVPILSAPRLSFPFTGERKSGWLPPSFNIDNRSGVELAVPYYWNIAPHRDATVTPRVLSRRGVGADLEWRYLEPVYAGELGLDVLPNDRVALRHRWAWRAKHQTLWPDRPSGPEGLRLSWDAHRVSDDDWWKDFPRATPGLTPRLLAQTAALERPWALAGGTGLAYARLAHWQVLQSADTILPPYRRSPQLGAQWRMSDQDGWDSSLETELNRFTLAREPAGLATRAEGWRWHARGELSRTWRAPGWWLRPGLSLKSAIYRTEGQPDAHITTPTLSLDAGAIFERRTTWLGRPLLQVLEPRVHYVRTPYRDQTSLPNYDAAGKDFNLTSIFSDNAWSGVDRVSDSHQVTLGATTRLIRETDGAELLRLGLAQRVLIDPERITPDDAEPTQIAAIPLSRQLSDLLMFGTSRLTPRWSLDAAVRYNADTRRVSRSVIGARYSAGPYRTLSAAYRYTRGQAEQVDVGWQWPLGGGSGQAGALPAGRFYSVGRVNYSMRDNRVTDSLLGLEYDAGCWIGRMVAERVSTGQSEATTRLMIQLELLGLSRLGTNPLRVLAQNIPGYRLLRDEPGGSPSTSTFHD